MEQKTGVDASSEKLDDSSNSPPEKRAKRQPEEKSSPSQITSNDAATTAENLNGANHISNQHPTNTKINDNQQPSKNGISHFILPSEEDSVRASEENLDPNSTGLKNSRTGEVWNKPLEEAHSTQVKERSLLGHLICSEETQKKILESDIFRILKSEGVIEIGALYKVSPSKFVLVFGSKAAKDKLENTEIQCRFGDSEICLNFHKRVGPLRNGREPIFVTILLPEFISDQAVRLAFSNFGDVVSVFKGNTDIRNGKRHVKIFPAGEDPATLPRKITFHGRIQRDVLFAEKVVLCYRCKTRHMLGENCPVVTPTTEDSSMSLAEQSVATVGSAAPVQPESSVKTQISNESQQTSPPIREEAEEGDSFMEDGSGSDSDSGSSSDDENGPELESKSRPDVPPESSPDLPSRENLSVVQGPQVNKEQDSQKPRTVRPSEENQTKKKTTPISSEKTEEQVSQNKKPEKPLKSLMDFPLEQIFNIWYRDKDNNIFRTVIADLGIKGDKDDIERLVKILGIAADVISEVPHGEKQFHTYLRIRYNRYFWNTPDDEKPSIEKFDNYLYCWALKIWPRALDIIRERVQY